jgi:hypothetical protein
MTDVRRADPTARWTAALVLVVGTCVGALLIAVFTRYRIPLSDWVLADQGASAQRVRLVFLLLTALLSAPLLALAVYLWSLGGRVVRAREFPPPGLRVIRDTPIVTGERAVARGRLLKVLAVGCVIASAVSAGLLWRLGHLLGRHHAT